MNKNLALLVAMNCLVSVCAAGVMVVDTTEREAELYRPMFDIIEHYGYQVDYRPLDVVLDSSDKDLTLLRAEYGSPGLGGRLPRAIFFIFGSEFLVAPEKSYVCSKVLQALAFVAQRPNLLIGLIFPSTQVPDKINLVSMYSRVFNQCGLDTPSGELIYPGAVLADKPATESSLALSASTFFYLTNIFLSNPLESRPLDFHTTLSVPRPGREFDLPNIKQKLAENDCFLGLLPANPSCSATIARTLPYGVYWYNNYRKNHIFVTDHSIWSFGGITENFRVTPLHSTLRTEMLLQINRMMFELFTLAKGTDKISTAKRLKSIDTLKTPKGMPACIANTYFAGKQFGPPEVRTTAWADTDIFKVCTPAEIKINRGCVAARKAQQSAFLQGLIDAKITAVWFTLNPQMYFSPIAKWKTAEDLKQYRAMVTNLGTSIIEAYKKAQAPLPGVYVGFEITNNLVEPNWPRKAPHKATENAVDLYEKVYTNLPVATDPNFWQEEVVDPFNQFLKMWHGIDDLAELPITGVVLDLEMYGSRRPGSFTTIMGFDNYSFQRFIKKYGFTWGAATKGSVAKRDRPFELIKRKKMSSYYAFLESEATDIGDSMKRAFNTALPDCNIMCYMPHIQISWFYKGLVKGLTSAEKPVHLLTFNSEFMAHQPWFEREETPVTHASVLMLSKIRSTSDFDIMTHLFMRHGGIWLNKFSRIVEPPAGGDWTNIEQLAIPEAGRPLFYKALQAL
jgi:hypothetical protein